YARMSASIERRTFLEAQLDKPQETRQGFIRRFLEPPIYRTRYDRAFGTLYTAVYDPVAGTAGYYWRNRPARQQSFADLVETEDTISLVQGRSAVPVVMAG